MPNKKKRKTKKRTKKKFSFKNHLLNFSIGGLVALIIVFLWSVISNSISRELSFQNDIPRLEKSDYEIRTGQRIEVELLNGCGVKKLAAKYERFFQNNGIDVKKCENATNYHHEKTKIILRNGEFIQAHEVAEVLQLPDSMITINKDPDSPFDITIILGHDYLDLESYSKVMNCQIPPKE